MKPSPLLAFIGWVVLTTILAWLIPHSARAWNNFVLVNTVVLVVLVRWDWVRRRRARETAQRPNGLCPACGYDLRATPERCPVCGRAASPSAS